MSKKILLADDSITIQKVIELTFSDEDFEVVTVGNGRLAIERVQDVRPDLVLCDIIMPEKDGYEVCDFIKKNPALSRTPVLLLTGAFEPFDQERATRVGCDGFLAKPFEPQTLIAKVKDLLGRASAPAVAPPAPAPPPAFVAAAPVAAAPAPPVPAPPPPSAATPFSAPSAAPAGMMPAAPAPAVPVPATTPPAPASASPAWAAHTPPPPSAVPAPPRQPEPFAFVPEPPPAYEPPAPPTPVLPFEEAGVSFFTDESFEEIPDSKPTAPSAPSGDAAPVPVFPETPDFEDFRASNFDEVGTSSTVVLSATPPPAPTAAAAPRPAPVAETRPAPGGSFPALDEDEGSQTLLHVSAEEAATLRGEPPPSARPTPAPAPPAPAPAPRTPARSPQWTQQTMEVPLETRARALAESAPLESEPVFEEVFDMTAAPARPVAPVEAPRETTFAPKPPAPAPVPPRVEAAAPAPMPAPAVAAAPVPAPVPAAAAAPAPAPSLAPAAVPIAAAPAPAPPGPASGRGSDDPITLSMRGGKEATRDGSAVPSSVSPAVPAEAEAVAGGASALSVPVDMVSQIAQRVVAQISEKVIREVAWEVIPELAETLIKNEIERLKAELQRT